MGFQIGIGDLDRGLRWGIGWCFGLRFGDWDCGLKIGDWDLDWGLGFRTLLEDLDKGFVLEIGD